MRFSEFLHKKHNQTIDEALTPAHERKADRMLESGHDFYRNRFLEHNPAAKERFKSQPDTKQWTTRETVELSSESGKPHADVSDFLNEKGYHITNDSYKRGIALKHTEVGDPSKGIEKRTKVVEHKIGRILEDHNADKDLTKKFVHDPYRVGKTTSKYDLVLTGNHHDVYGGSTNRSWTSCTDMDTDKVGTDHMKDEINNHTHHVYIVPHGGSVDHDAIARTSYKMHTGMMSGHQTLLPEHNVYGTAPQGFVEASHKFVGSLFHRKPEEVYKKHEAIYDDAHKPFIFPEGHHVTPETLDTVWKNGVDTKDNASIAHVAVHVQSGMKYKSRILNDTAKGMEHLQNGVKSGDYQTMSSHVLSASAMIPNHYIVHQAEPIEKALEDGAKTFNISNPKHVESLQTLNRIPNQLYQKFKDNVIRSIGPAKTVVHYHAMGSLLNHGVTFQGKSYRVPIAHDHQMGRYPMDAIVKHHQDTNTLDHETFTRAYLSTHSDHLNSRKGNLYDQAVHYEKQGVPGMSNVVQGIAQKLHNKFVYGYPGENQADGVAHTYMHMQPSTRTRIAEAAGTDVKSVMKNGKNGVARYKESQNEQ